MKCVIIYLAINRSHPAVPAALLAAGVGLKNTKQSTPKTQIKIHQKRKVICPKNTK